VGFRAISGASRWLARLRPAPVLGVAALLGALAVAGVTLHALATPHAPPPGRATLEAIALADANGVLDSDRDGVSDSRENFLYGTNPHKASTSGSGIPDGWLVKYGLDPLDAGIAQAPAATPPGALLPASYGGVWPTAFTPTVGDIYSHGRPAGYNESATGPYDSGLDPRQWDSNGDGIPDAFLLHFGLDPLARDIGGQRLAGPGGLTVQQAYEHKTDPGKLDTDGDGIPDAEEIAGPLDPRTPGVRFPPTDPTRFDTSGAGVCDGYLRAHGLDPSPPASAYGDPDLDGATTREEFLWSQQRFGGAACTGGKGLDPNEPFSGGLPIPDGWLLRYGLDPLDPATPTHETERAASEPGPAVEPHGGVAVPDDLALTVWDEYNHSRPATWDERVGGPWWGGTNPQLNDTDGDGLGDAWELRGYVVVASTDPFQGAGAPYVTHSDPTAADSDGDGLGDGVEADKARNGGYVMDAERRDTDFDGIPDGEEVGNGYKLDPTRADSTAVLNPDGTVSQEGDHLLDGQRLALLKARAELYATNPAYGGPNPNGQLHVTQVFASLKPDCAAPPPATLAPATLAKIVGPLGDVDCDGTLNIVDGDMDGDLLDNGVELRPDQYSRTSFGTGSHGRSATDPLNPDTDGDLLLDGWEVQHGLDVSGSFTMDPAKWDSGSGHCPNNAPACSDGAKDPDGDSITWYSYGADGATISRKANDFAFPNQLEQQEKTDPNAASSDGDGLGDGWKYFWETAYANQGNPGLYHPDLGSVFSSPARPHLHTAYLAGDPRATLVAADYARTVLADDNGAPAPGTLIAANGEAAVGNPFNVAIPSGHKVLQVHGTVRFTFADAQALGTNPYMATDPRSTDGDGLPDWWETLMTERLPGMGTETGFGLCKADGGPDPVVPDGAADPDADGLPNLLEFTHDAPAPAYTLTLPPATSARWSGGNPLCQDSDMGGIHDDGEANLATLKLGDPRDDTTQSSSKDSDSDGLSDFQELLSSPASDPGNADSDGDGLLDGHDQGPYALDGSAAGHLARYWLDLGIAYSRQTSGGVASYTFLGELDAGTHAMEADAAGAGVPEGWLVAHHLDLAGHDSCRAYYQMFRPTWWKEAVHGPWWGGLVPGTEPSPCPDVGVPPDSDRDGLGDRDANGEPYEDPLPANHANVAPTLDFGQYGGQPGIPDSGTGAPNPADAAVPTPVRRLAGQAFFGPRTEGPGYPVPSGWTAPAGREVPCIVVGSFDPVAGLGPLELPKGTERILHGKVVHRTNGSCQASGTGIAGVTVEGRMGASGTSDLEPQLFGATVTDGGGAFALPVNIAVDHQATVPAGSVLRGATATTVAWQAVPAIVGPGSGRNLQVLTYATPSLDKASAALTGIQVRSAPHIAFTQSGNDASVGQDLAVGVRVTDLGGTPLAKRVVRLTLGTGPDASAAVGTTDGKGVWETLLHVPSQLGSVPLVAQSDGGDDGLGPATSTTAVTVRALPSFQDLDVPETADAGSFLPVGGIVTVQGDGAPNAHVTVKAVGGGAEASATTDGAGRFHASVPLDPGAHGRYTLQFAVAQGPTNLAGQGTAFVSVRSLTQWSGVSDGPIRSGTAFTVQAQLVAADGRTGIANVPVHIAFQSLQADAVTDETGAINATLPGAVAPHPSLLQLEFAGDAEHAPASAQVERDVSSPTLLLLPAGVAARGGDARIDIALTDAAGGGVAGAPLVVAWGSEPNRTVVTDRSGHALFVRHGSPADPLGTVTVQARYNGTRDGTHGPAKARATWALSSLAEVVLPTGNATAGAPVPPGLLRDAGTLQPVPRGRVTLLVTQAGAPARWSNVTSDGLGHFEVLPPIPATAEPVLLHIVAASDASAAYPAATAAGDLRIRSPTTLEAQLPAALVAGRATVVPVRIGDALHRTVSAGTVQAFLDSEQIGSGEVRDGEARIVTTPPATASGPAFIRFAYLGSTVDAASEVAGATHLLAPANLTLEIHPGRAGGTTRVAVLATAAGQPLPFVTVTLAVQGQPGGLSALTDKAGMAEFLVPQGNETRLVSAALEQAASLSPASASTLLAPLRPLSALEAGTSIAAWVLGTLAVLAVGGAVAAMALRRHPLTAAFRRTRAVLAAEGDLEKQVLLAYRELEDAAIAHELLAGPAKTPRLLEEAIAPGLPEALRPNLDLLISVFEMARYGRVRLRPLERDAALEALDNLCRQLNRADPVWGPAARHAAGAP
jgi:hypothetical protein